MTSHQPGMSDDAVLAATGKDWAAWRAFLDEAGAADLSHAQIAKMLRANGVQAWWRQMVTVGYERMIGRRVVGQNCDGNFSASASKTLAGNMDEALERWSSLVAEQIEFVGAFAADQPRVTSSEKWRYWRIDLEDGSRVTVHFSNKTDAKCTAGVNHDKLADEAGVASAKLFWKDLLSQI